MVWGWLWEDSEEHLWETGWVRGVSCCHIWGVLLACRCCISLLEML